MALFKKKVSEEEKEALETEQMEDDELESVNGGYVFYHMDFDKGKNEYQVIDDTTGEVLATHNWHQAAERDCRQRGLSGDIVAWSTVERLRSEYKAACEKEAEEKANADRRRQSVILP